MSGADIGKRMQGGLSSRIALECSSDDFAMPDALRFLASMRKSGCASFEWRTGAARVFMRDGRLGAGGLQPDDVHVALVAAGLTEPAPPGAPTEALVDDLLRTGDAAIHALLERRRMDALCAVLTAEPVRLRFLSDVDDPFPQLGDVGLDDALDELHGKVAQVRESNLALGDRSRALALAVDVPHDEVRLTPAAWELLAAVRDYVSMDALVRGHAGGEADALAALVDLVQSGLVIPVECVTATAPAVEPARTPDTEVGGAHAPGTNGFAAPLESVHAVPVSAWSDDFEAHLTPPPIPASSWPPDMPLEDVGLDLALATSAGLSLQIPHAGIDDDFDIDVAGEFEMHIAAPPMPESSWPPVPAVIQQEDYPTLPEVPAIYFPTAHAEDPAQAERNRLVADLRSLLGG